MTPRNSETRTSSGMRLPSAVRAGTLLAALLLAFASARANPVPDAAVREFNELPRRVAEGHTEDRARLEADFGNYGLDLLDPATLEYMGRHFDQIKDTIVISQRPPYEPSYRLQDWYRERAKVADRFAMIAALRSWLTASVQDAPRHGSSRLAWPEDAVRESILGARIAAAGSLADWGDRGSLPQIRALNDSIATLRVVRRDRDGSLSDQLACVIKHLEDPDHFGFLVSTAGGKYLVRRSPAEVKEAVLRDYQVADRPLDHEQVQRLWGLLGQSEAAERTQWVSSNKRLQIHFEGGLTATLSPTEPGYLTYLDNSLVPNRECIRIHNPALCDAIARLAGPQANEH